MLEAKRKRAPCVDMRTDVHKDERFSALADIAGFPGGRYEAIGRMHALWSWCVDRKLQDAPADSDGYVVSAGVVMRFLGQSGVMALLAEGCDELALGVEIERGKYYLRGTSEYVSALRGLNKSAVAGGKARTSGASRDNGKFVAENTNAPAVTSRGTSCPPAVHQPSPAVTPAVTSVLPLSSLLSPTDHTLSPPARRTKTGIPPTWTPAAAERERAVQLGLNVDLEAEEFRSYWLGTGKPMKDWDAVFRSRLIQRSKQQPYRQGGLQLVGGIRRSEEL